MHPRFCWGGLNLLPNFKEGGGLIGPQLSEGVGGKEGSNFFQGGCNFYARAKLKSEIFNGNKKFINKNFFLCHK